MTKLLAFEPAVIAIAFVPFQDVASVLGLASTCRRMRWVLRQEVVWHALMIRDFPRLGSGAHLPFIAAQLQTLKKRLSTYTTPLPVDEILVRLASIRDLLETCFRVSPPHTDYQPSVAVALPSVPRLTESNFRPTQPEYADFCCSAV